MSDYKILEKLGEGGMGIVHRAVQQPLGREVALKRLHPGGAAQEAMKKRFLHEIQALMRLSHPGVIRVYDAGTMEGALYYSMEFIQDARALSQVIRAEGPIEAPRALGFVRQMLEALVAVHAVGMVHRDIKPSNVLLTGGDRILLMDFGLVKDAEATALTSPGDVLGSLPYLAPEMLLGQPASPLTDIWAVGVVLYELLTRRNAFQGDSMDALLRAIVHEPPPRAIEHRPTVPEVVQALLDRLMQKEVAQRLPTAAAALDAVKECEAAIGPRARPSRQLPRPSRNSTAVEPVVRAGGRKVGPFAIGLGFVSAVALAFGWYARRAPPPVTTVASPVEEPPVTSATPPPAGIRAVTRALQAFSPYSQLRALERDFDQAMKKGGNGIPDPELVARWDGKLGALRASAGLDELSAGTDPGTDREDLLSFHRVLSDLEDLERLIDRLDIPWKARARSLELPGYRALEARKVLEAPLAGVAYRISNRDPLQADKDLDGIPAIAVLPTKFSSPLETFVDPRDPPREDAFDFGAGAYTHPEPLDARARGADRIDVLMSGTMAGASFRLLVATDPKAPPAAWRPIARFRPVPGEPAWIGHTLPGSVLAPAPLYWRLELVPDHGLFLEPRGVGQTRAYLWAILFRRISDVTSVTSTSPTPHDARGALEGALAALQKLGPRGILVRLHREFQKVYHAGGDAETRARPLRASWKLKLRQALDASGVEEALARLRPHLAAIHAESGPFEEGIRTLYAFRHDLDQLEEVGRQMGVPLPELGRSLETPAYAPAPASPVKPIYGISLVFTHHAEKFGEPKLPRSPVLTVRETTFGNPFEVMLDPLDSGFKGAWEVASGYAWLDVPVTLPDGADGKPHDSVATLDWVTSTDAATAAVRAKQVRLQLDCRGLTERTGFRIFTAPAYKAPFSSWKLLAVLRAEDWTRPIDEPRILEHRVPIGLLAGEPEYLVVTLSYDHARSITESKSIVARGSLRELRVVFEPASGD